MTFLSAERWEDFAFEQTRIYGSSGFRGSSLLCEDAYHRFLDTAVAISEFIVANHSSDVRLYVDGLVNPSIVRVGFYRYEINGTVQILTKWPTITLEIDLAAHFSGTLKKFWDTCVNGTRFLSLQSYLKNPNAATYCDRMNNRQVIQSNPASIALAQQLFDPICYENLLVPCIRPVEQLQRLLPDNELDDFHATIAQDASCHMSDFRLRINL